MMPAQYIVEWTNEWMHNQTRLIKLSYLLDNTASEKYFKELGFSYISTSFFTNL